MVRLEADDGREASTVVDVSRTAIAALEHGTVASETRMAPRNAGTKHRRGPGSGPRRAGGAHPLFDRGLPSREVSPPGQELGSLPEVGAPVRDGSDGVAQRRDEAKAGCDPCALITTVTETYNRISMHGVRRELLALQAQALGLPLAEVLIPASCSNELYETRMREALASEQLRSVASVAFGDLFLEDVRAYREERLAAAGRGGLFPLWGRDTTELAQRFISLGFEAIIVCVDPRTLDAAFAGRRYDERLLAELPPDVDPCGENGEFHTFVHGGPIFRRPIAWTPGEVIARDGFVFADLAPA